MARLAGGAVGHRTYGWGLMGTIYHSDDAGYPFLLFSLWIVVTSIVLMRRAGEPLPTVSTAPTSHAIQTG